ncbi:hypothetical protein BABINDRAFT_161256 [Babjeviella inositovora NRRL Y-12698]|uniref:Uncharacterized protein n=1 Tax=Babjeviella inositovora NRRL Y-12698 TaxID=984486 RepID=A0A1E3QRH1_9ASCO|nr:uncharacterized protein BABINDRAFT_161256 [Babjeviella inositovora NRRL Y-12698]ODQ80295.1 hypothetical protein BABINDRAFT_161256 [Babjeviella inositovora NRRL Y-12698]
MCRYAKINPRSNFIPPIPPTLARSTFCAASLLPGLGPSHCIALFGGLASFSLISLGFW